MASGEVSAEHAPTAAGLVIGNEILSGRTRDRNLHSLATALDAVGIRLREARMVADDSEAIKGAVNALRHGHDHLFTSGGIGPTHDDITADSVAAAFEIGICVRPDARAMLAARYPEGQLNEARLRMARVPDGAELIPNPVSGAPGFRVGNVWVMAGVPRVFDAMLAHVLARLPGGRPLVRRSIRADVPEGAHADGLRIIAGRNPQLSVGSYPFSERDVTGSVIVVSGREEESVERCTRDIASLLRDRGARSLQEEGESQPRTP